MPELNDDKYGTEVYSQVYKKGNRRYVTTVRESENGELTALFRKFMRKEQPDGKRVTFLNQETIVSAANPAAFRRADFPDYPEAIKFLHSDFFKSL